VSSENVERVRRGVADVEAFWAMLDEFVTWDLRAWPTIDLEPVHVGREAVIAASRRYWGTWTDYSVEAEEIIDAGASVVVIIRERGRGKGSGAPFEQFHPQLWTFREGRVVRWESFPTRESAMEAAGLSD
jgi:ketosteroid isomerase-like protein